MARKPARAKPRGGGGGSTGGGGKGSAVRSPRLHPAQAARAAERFGQAALAHRAGRLAAAEAGYREVLAVNPRFPGAALNYALLARATGRPSLALDLARAAAAHQPSEPAAHNTLGNLLYERQRSHEAVAAYRTALGLDPGYLNARFNLGKALQQTGEPEAAEAEFRALVELHPDDPALWTALGGALLDAGRPGDAAAAHRRALDFDPERAEAWLELGLAHAGIGEFDEAARCYRRVLDADPGCAAAWLGYSKTRRFTPADRAELEAAQAAAAQLARDAEANANAGAKGRRRREAGAVDEASAACGDLHFALGKMYDDLGEYDTAFEHYRRGNELVGRQAPFDPEGLERFAGALESAFDAAWFERVRGWGDPSPRPVFIVGMARSGTSLVEQILASHPQVYGAGELIRIPNLARRLLGPAGGSGPGALAAAAAQVGRADVEAAARDYLDYTGARSEGAARVTDKLPENYHHVGVVAALFPNARIVWVRRDPVDLCVSNYLVRFRQGHAYSYGLESLACEHRFHERLMRHWRAALPAGVCPVREQSYEALVDSPEAESRALVEFCGLEWDERCLDFHRTRRPVHTASGWQVRQPLYRRSVGRWRNYERHLGPLLDALRRDGAIAAP